MTKRNIRICMAVLLFLLSTLCACKQGAGPEWDSLNKQAEDLYRAGDYDRALTVAKKSLEVAEENDGPDHQNVAESLNILAFFVQHPGSVRAGRTAL